MTGPKPLLDGLDDRLAVVGTSGAGKTYAAKVLVELLARTGRRFVVVDPLGVWWGLRAGADGRAEGGLEVLILGGKRGDVQLQEAHGDAIGRLLGSSEIQCVVDLSELPSKASRQRFMRAFLERLQETNEEPLHLVLDEADMWAPQRPGPEEAVLQGRVGEIVRRGRAAGIVPWVITQRPAVLTKDVLSQADALIAMKLTSSQDRAAIGAWIEGAADAAQKKRILADLPGLPRGTGWLWAPSRGVLIRMPFPKITTFDSSRTPVRGEKRAGAALAPIDAAVLARALAAPAAEPVRKAATTKVSADQLAAAREEGRQAGLAEGEAARKGLQDELRRVAVALGATLSAVDAYLQPGGAPVHALATPRPASTPARPSAGGQRSTPKPAPPTGDGVFHSAARAMLAILAPRAPHRLTWRQVATLAALAPAGGHWNVGRRQLRDLGLVNENVDGVAATPEGVARFGPAPPPPITSAELLELWSGKVGQPAGAILRLLSAAPEPMTWPAIADRLGIAGHGGHFNVGRRRLRDNGLVVETPLGVVAVAELR